MASTRIRYWLFCVALLIGLCCVAPAAMAAPAANLRVAKVTALSGEVQVKKAGGEKNFKAFKNMGLSEGDTIITGEASSLTLELDDFEEVRIGEKSHVLISELRVALDESSEQTTFNLLAGGLWSNIRKQLNLDSRYQIKTANAVMGVRGTMWYTAHRDGHTDVAVLEGTVLTTPNLPPQSQPGFEPPAYSLTAGQQVSLDMPPAQSEDFVVQPLMPESFDLLLLQMIDELSGTRPDVVPPSMALQVQQLISQFQPPPAPPAPPAPRMILDPLVVPQQPDDVDDDVQVPTNTPPNVSGAHITGQCYLGGTMRVLYEYSDAEGNPEGNSTYQWYYAAAPEAITAEWQAIPGATSREYSPSETLIGTWLRCIVTPHDGLVAGLPIPSSPSSFPVGRPVPVENLDNMTITLGIGSSQMILSEVGLVEENVVVESSSTCVVVGRELESSTVFITLTPKCVGVAEVTVTLNYPGYVETEYTFTVTVTNQAPTVTSARIAGTPRVGEELTLDYDYYDVDYHSPGTSIFRWYRSSQPDGSELALIDGANTQTYTLVPADEGKYIYAEIVPVDEWELAGDPVQTTPVGPVAAGESTTQPTDVSIDAAFSAVGVLVNAEYNYESQQPSDEVELVHRWYRGSADSGVDRQQIAGADSERYLPTQDDVGYYLWYSVQVTAPERSAEVFSEKIGPITNYQGTTPQLSSVTPAWQGDTLTWTPVLSALGYEIQIFTSSGASTPWITRHVFGNTGEYDFAELLQMGDLREGNAKYYAAVKAIGCGIMLDAEPGGADVNQRGVAAPVTETGFTDVGEAGGPIDFAISFSAADSTGVSEYRVLLIPDIPWSSHSLGFTLADANALPSSAFTSVEPGDQTTIYQVALKAGQTDVYGMPIVENVDYWVDVLSVADGDTAKVSSLAVERIRCYTLTPENAQEPNGSRLRFVRAATDGGGMFTLRFNSEIRTEGVLDTGDFQVIPYLATAGGELAQTPLVAPVDFETSVDIDAWEIGLSLVAPTYEESSSVRYEVALMDTALSKIRSIYGYSWEGPTSHFTTVVDCVSPLPVVWEEPVAHTSKFIISYEDTPHGDQSKLTGTMEDGEVDRLVRLASIVDCQRVVDVWEGRVNSIVARLDGSIEIDLPDARLGEFNEVVISFRSITDASGKKGEDYWTLGITDNGLRWMASWHNYNY